MARGKILLVLLLLAAMLAGGLMAIRSGTEEAPPAASAQEEAYSMLYTRTRQDFQSMTVTLADGESFTVVSDMGFDAKGNLLGVYNSMGQPVLVEGQPDFALDSISYQMMLLTAVNLPVTGSYLGLDPQACGLDTPAARIEINYHAGEPITLTIGKTTFSGNSCYVQMLGDDNVYLVPVDFYQTMTQPLNAHHRLPGALSTQASLVQLAVVYPDGERFIVSNYGTENRILPWQVDEPYVHAGSTERIAEFAQAVAGISAAGYVGTAATAADLASYGLDAPTSLLTAYADGTIRDIRVGNDAGDGHVYARLDSTGDVYLVRKEQLPRYDQQGTDQLLDRFVALISTNDVDTAAVMAGEEAWLLAVSKDEGGETQYAINGRTMDSAVFAEAYTALVGMQFDKTADDAPAGEALCEVRFLHKSGAITRVSYAAYDAHYVLAETSGGGRFLVRRERLDEMLQTVRLAGQS